MDKKFKRFTENMNSSVPFFPYILETHTIILKKYTGAATRGIVMFGTQI